MFFFSIFWNFDIVPPEKGKRVKNVPKWQKIISIALLISEAIHQMIAIYGAHILNDHISSFLAFFFFFNFSKFWFSKMSEGWKGKKGLNWEKNYVCLTQSQELYIKWLWFLVRMCKMMISLVVERGKKWPKITNFSLLYLGNCRSYHQDFDNDISRCFSLFF